MTASAEKTPKQMAAAVAQRWFACMCPDAVRGHFAGCPYLDRDDLAKEIAAAIREAVAAERRRANRANALARAAIAKATPA